MNSASGDVVVFFMVCGHSYVSCWSYCSLGPKMVPIPVVHTKFHCEQSVSPGGWCKTAEAQEVTCALSDSTSSELNQMVLALLMASVLLPRSEPLWPFLASIEFTVSCC